MALRKFLGFIEKIAKILFWTFSFQTEKAIVHDFRSDFRSYSNFSRSFPEVKKNGIVKNFSNCTVELPRQIEELKQSPISMDLQFELTSRKLPKNEIEVG